MSPMVRFGSVVVAWGLRSAVWLAYSVFHTLGRKQRHNSNTPSKRPHREGH